MVQQCRKRCRKCNDFVAHCTTMPYQTSTRREPLPMHRKASNSDDSSSESSNERIPMVDERGVRPMSSASSSTPLPSSMLKAKPVGKWSRDAQMALLEAANEFGIWEYKNGSEKAISPCHRGIDRTLRTRTFRRCDPTCL